MDHPEVYYALALGMFVIAEAGFRVFHRSAFGPMTWVLGSVFALSYAALWTGIDLPHAQLTIHMVALVVGFLVARGLVGHITASLFLPMSMLGGLMVWGKISGSTWWWGLFYLACLQLVLLGMGSNLHPIGRQLRRWGSQLHQHFNKLVGIA